MQSATAPNPQPSSSGTATSVGSASRNAGAQAPADAATTPATRTEAQDRRAAEDIGAAALVLSLLATPAETTGAVGASKGPTTVVDLIAQSSGSLAKLLEGAAKSKASASQQTTSTASPHRSATPEHEATAA